MSTEPDTIEAAAEAIVSLWYSSDRYDQARVAIAADRKALAEQGYVIVNANKLKKFILDHWVAIDGEWGLGRSAKQLLAEKDRDLVRDLKRFGLWDSRHAE